MPTLSAMFKILDGGYSSALNKINSGMEKAIQSTPAELIKSTLAWKRQGVPPIRGRQGLLKLKI